MNTKNGSESENAGVTVFNGSRLNVTQCLFATDNRIKTIAIGARKMKFINLRKMYSPHNTRLYFIDLVVREALCLF